MMKNMRSDIAYLLRKILMKSSLFGIYLRIV